MLPVNPPAMQDELSKEGFEFEFENANEQSPLKLDENTVKRKFTSFWWRIALFSCLVLGLIAIVFLASTIIVGQTESLNGSSLQTAKLNIGYDNSTKIKDFPTKDDKPPGQTFSSPEEFCSRNGDSSLKSCCIAWEHEETKLEQLESDGLFHSRQSNQEMVPRKVWVFWFGAPMKGKRAEAFESLKANVGVPVELVTNDNLMVYEVPEHPFHPAVKYSLPSLAANSTAPKGLSAIHVGDYLRVYFMHHYGGGYHDVKPHAKENSWAESFDRFSDTSVWIVGVQEIPGGFGCSNRYVSGIPDCERWRLGLGDSGATSCCSRLERSDSSKWAITNVAYIMRPKTRLTYEWLRNVECALSEKFKDIMVHPAPTFRCCQWYLPENKAVDELMLMKMKAYPISWAMLHGEAFGPLQYKFREHIRQGLPKWKSGEYRSE